MMQRTYDHGMRIGDYHGEERPEGWQTPTWERLQRLELYASPRVAFLAVEGLPQTHRRLLPRHSFTSLLADLATICANHVQPAHDMPAFTTITTPTPLQPGPSNYSASPTVTA